ncbi:MAG: hypothetical protein WBX15_19400 [Thermoanaerobaculia bacterium]
MRRSYWLLALLLTVACATTKTPPPAATAEGGHPHLAVGFRYSAYGPDYNPGPAYWSGVGDRMVSRFPGSKPATVWIVGRIAGEGTELSFPGSSDDPLIRYADQDANEAALTLFDQRGFDCWLQVEPGNASVEKLIDIVLDRYGSHPCVVGIGVDVEWFRSVEEPEGDAVTDADASAWLAAVRRHDPAYRLFLKHWMEEKMPPTVREGILFIDDSQIFPSLDAMIDEFTEWGRSFASAPVGFQFGYPSDRPWWQKLDDPAKAIGQPLVERVPNLEGLYWVDFTVLDVFPPPPDVVAAHMKGSPEWATNPIVGVKMYELPADLEQMFAKWNELGVTTAFVGESVAEDDAFRRAASERGVDVFIIVPVFQNPEALKADPDLVAITSKGAPAKDDWVEFVCPSRQSYREERVQHVRDLVTRLHPQGVSLDFIRHFVFWEKVHPGTKHGDIPNACFCDHCVKGFTEKSGIVIPPALHETPEVAAWILENHAREWTEWKVALIDSMAEEIASAAHQADPQIRINIHAVPWRRTDFGGAILRSAGQDFETLSKYADYLSPMTYAHIQGRMPDWVHSVVVRLSEQSSAPVLPSIQVAEAYRPGEPFTVEEFEQNLYEALRMPSRGVVFWSWEALAADPAKFRVAVEMIGTRTGKRGRAGS